ncbi:MAG: hypothetical protein BAJALOKI2v1_440020 [Promethearchaeota archaeon]|nr:MAG: hypothetical protein BAJALOKI2v1_440020 [Candidatus Lokiarchaeota archaeon]
MRENKDHKKKFVYCCISNCQKKIQKEEAIFIEDKFFCKTCGTAYFRTALNI